MTDTNTKPLVCIFTIHPDGDVRIFNRQALSLVKVGWDVTLIARGVESGEENREGVRLITIKRPSGPLGRLKTILKTFQLALKQKADVYHFHDFAFLPLAAIGRLLTWKPFIYDIHEFYCIKIPIKLPNKFFFRQIAGAMLKAFEWVCTKICGHVSAVTKHHDELYRKAGCKVVFTPNYASLKDFNMPELTEEEWANRKNTVVFIGTLGKAKGALLMVDIARLIKQARPEIKLIVTRRFLVPRQEKEMLDYMKETGTEDAITWVPNVSGAELPEIVRRGMVGLSLLQDVGQYSQSIPTKFFEYMSQGLAIIASDLPPSHWVIGQENCGRIIPPSDPQPYVDVILWCLDNPEATRQMGLRGQRAFAEKYNWEIIEKDLCEFYRQICPVEKRQYLKQL